MQSNRLSEFQKPQAPGEHKAIDMQKALSRTEDDIKENPKNFWKFVNSKKSHGVGVAEYVKLDSKVAHSKDDAVELFDEYFQSVYEKSDDDLQSNNVSTWNSLSISMDEIQVKLKNLCIDKAKSPDGIPPIFYKRCATVLTFPIFLIFNRSLETGVFPTLWKHADVAVIHKSGSANDVKNYRPISKLSIIAKIFDSILADEVFKRFKKVIIPQQHGFFKKRSTVTNLVSYTKKLQRAIDDSNQVDSIYTDFSKAFDKVSPTRLLQKLEAFGIAGKMLEWFKSYITRRHQRVQIGECFSKSFEVLSSVAQGSHLGPLLFSLYINDIGEIMQEIDFCLYADDLKMQKCIESVEDAHHLQASLDRLQVYVKENQLQLNVKKCVITSFTTKTSSAILHPYAIDGEILCRKREVRDVGITFDSKLKFNHHVEKICSKARQMYGFITRVEKEFKKPETMKLLYCSLVLAILKAIEKILNLETLEMRRVVADVKFTINSFNDVVDSQTFIHHFNFNVPERSTRNFQVFRTKSSKKEIGISSVTNRLMSSFNKFCGDSDLLLHRKCSKCIKTITKAKFITQKLLQTI